MSSGVSLVIPGRNCARTLPACLGAAAAILNAPDSPLREIIFVDDASTDDSRSIAARYPVTILNSPGAGPGAARNIGWRAARGEFIWFIDSDCVPEPDALKRLMAHFDGPHVGGVGGSYGNMTPESLLGSIIHEEIVERHRVMPARVNYFGGFNVVYRRSAVERAGGFDERLITAEDADLSYRVHAAGFELRFDPNSRVGHFHPTRLRGYFRTQRRHGYWRVFLYMAHPHAAGGDAYSGPADHLQPVLAMLSLAAIPLCFLGRVTWLAPALLGGVALLQFPMMLRILRRTKQARYLAFLPLGLARAYVRGVGMTHGLLAWLLRAHRRRTPSGEAVNG